MRVSVVILFAVLVAGTAGNAIHPILEPQPFSFSLDRNIIDDACKAYDCLLKALDNLQDKLNDVVDTVMTIADGIKEIDDDIDTCYAIGGDDPSFIEEIQQVRCLLRVANKLRSMMVKLVFNVKRSIDQVIIAAKDIPTCFRKGYEQPQLY